MAAYSVSAAAAQSASAVNAPAMPTMVVTAPSDVESSAVLFAEPSVAAQSVSAAESSVVSSVTSVELFVAELSAVEPFVWSVIEPFVAEWSEPTVAE